MGNKTHRPSMKRFVIARSIQNEMEAQKGRERQRIPVIVSLRDPAVASPAGIQESKQKVLDFVRSKTDQANQVSESDFYVFASLFPEDIGTRQTAPICLSDLERRDDLRPLAQFCRHSKGHFVLANL